MKKFDRLLDIFATVMVGLSVIIVSALIIFDFPGSTGMTAMTATVICLAVFSVVTDRILKQHQIYRTLLQIRDKLSETEKRDTAAQPSAPETDRQDDRKGMPAKEVDSFFDGLFGSRR